MRRDYFTCVFLSCVCAALFFVCFTPLYFTYGAIVPRDFGLMERIMSAVYAVMVLFVIPVYAAIRKKFWISFGLALYGTFVLLPVWMLPGIADKVAGEGASVVYVAENFILRSIYSMSRAPFAALSTTIGDKRAESLPNWIMGVALTLYVVVQLFRFYRDAYLNEKMDPKTIMDTTAKENEAHRNPETPRTEQLKPKPEVLGTVISAPATPAAPVKTTPTPTNQATTKAIPKPEEKPVLKATPTPAALKSGDDTIYLGAPSVTADKAPSDETIQLLPPKPNNDTPFDENGAIRL